MLRERIPATTRESLKGLLVHEVLSQFFDRDRGSRDLQHLHELFRGVMTKLIEQEKVVRENCDKCLGRSVFHPEELSDLGLSDSKKSAAATAAELFLLWWLFY